MKFLTNCQKIFYCADKNSFCVEKDGRKKYFSFNKLKMISYSDKKDKQILLKSLSVYFSNPFPVNAKTGKKIVCIL